MTILRIGDMIDLGDCLAKIERIDGERAVFSGIILAYDPRGASAMHSRGIVNIAYACDRLATEERKGFFSDEATRLRTIQKERDAKIAEKRALRRAAKSIQYTGDIHHRLWALWERPCPFCGQSWRLSHECGAYGQQAPSEQYLKRIALFQVPDYWHLSLTKERNGVRINLRAAPMRHADEKRAEDQIINAGRRSP